MLSLSYGLGKWIFNGTGVFRNSQILMYNLYEYIFHVSCIYITSVLHCSDIFIRFISFTSVRD